MTDEINKENCRILLANFIEKESITKKDLSKKVGCSTPTVSRILGDETHPTDKFIEQVGIMIITGFKKYSKLSDTEKESISEAIGSVGGGVLGFGAITAAVSASGTVAGLSAAGIASGLAAIGVGGMTGGILTVAAIPIAAGGIGYGIVKGIKYLISDKKSKSIVIDEIWEIEKS